MVSPQKALVKPRVLSRETNESIPLEDVIESYLAGNFRGNIELSGGNGTGKTTALAHLACLELAEDLVLVDDAWRTSIELSSTDKVVVYTTRRQLNVTDERYELAPWSTDDLIEYLLALAPDRCSQVLQQLMADEDYAELEGVPALLCLVAGQMAKHDDIRDVRSALRRAMQEFTDSETLDDLRYCASALVFSEHELAESRARIMLRRGVPRGILSLISFRFLQILLTADRVTSVLLSNAEFPFPAYVLPVPLIAELARQIKKSPATLEALQELGATGDVRYLPMVASVLHAADRLLTPDRERLYFPGAYLPRVQWQSLDLSGLDAIGAHLSGADVTEANLFSGKLDFGNFQKLQGSEGCFSGVSAVRADFTMADLRFADLSRGKFTEARFVGADLQDVVAAHAEFQDADLKNCSLRGAILVDSNLSGAVLTATDLRDSDLSGANLSEQVLQSALLSGANLTRANLNGADLEFVELWQPSLSEADLRSARLTGSVITEADLRDARLNGAGLAEISWERADLRNADLRGATFHMGSSRSGLVGSPYPGHGSRTGFYTNDYEDRTFKDPAEIRKANLCGVDLRGARIEGVDFYLVDLRDAIYSPDQEAHFRRCDAILHDPQ